MEVLSIVIAVLVFILAGFTVININLGAKKCSTAPILVACSLESNDDDPLEFAKGHITNFLNNHPRGVGFHDLCEEIMRLPRYESFDQEGGRNFTREESATMIHYLQRRGEINRDGHFFYANNP